MDRALWFADGMLATPLYEFDHAHTDSTASLVGTMHIGRPSYYEAIQAVADATTENGGAVHFESVRAVDDTVLETVPPEIAEDVRALRGVTRATRLAAESLGLTYQGDALRRRANWENHDMNELELAQMLGRQAVRALVAKDASLDRISEWSPRVRETMFRLAMHAIPLSGSLVGILPGVKKAVVEHRNALQLSAVADGLATDPDRSLALIWGAGHTPGLRTGLEQLGYRMRNRHWLGAVPLRGSR